MLVANIQRENKNWTMTEQQINNKYSEHKKEGDTINAKTNQVRRKEMQNVYYVAKK